MKDRLADAQKAREARWWYAERAGQKDAWDAAYDAIEAVGEASAVEDVNPEPEHDFEAWPISGDDLALAKAGRIA
jgi:hypothetical protein